MRLPEEIWDCVRGEFIDRVPGGQKILIVLQAQFAPAALRDGTAPQHFDAPEWVKALMTLKVGRIELELSTFLDLVTASPERVQELFACIRAQRTEERMDGLLPTEKETVARLHREGYVTLDPEEIQQIVECPIRRLAEPVQAGPQPVKVEHFDRPEDDDGVAKPAPVAEEQPAA